MLAGPTQRRQGESPGRGLTPGHRHRYIPGRVTTAASCRWQHDERKGRKNITVSQRILHLDPFGGAAGDMILGALLDLGVDAAVVTEALTAVGLGAVRLEVQTAQRRGLGGRRVRFVDASGIPIDPLERGTSGEGAEVGHTPWSEIRARLEAAPLANPVRRTALHIFGRLAAAEAQVHGVPVEDVVLHEVGAIDAIGDIVGAAAAVHALGVDQITCGPIPLGGGEISAAHGKLPVPAPATALLCVGASVRGLDVDYECTTPTGAAVLTTLAERYGPLPSGTVRGVGEGLGRRDPVARANLLRAFLLDTTTATLPESEGVAEAVEICTNLDDESGEVCADVVERLLAAGALDAWTIPAAMKKGRPAVVLHALVAPALHDEACEILLRETSTLGVRAHAVTRRTLARRTAEVETPFGVVRVKRALLGDRVVKVKPEFEDCRRLAREHGVALRTVQLAATRAASGEESP